MSDSLIKLVVVEVVLQKNVAASSESPVRAEGKDIQELQLTILSEAVALTDIPIAVY